MGNAIKLSVTESSTPQTVTGSRPQVIPLVSKRCVTCPSSLESTKEQGGKNDRNIEKKQPVAHRVEPGKGHITGTNHDGHHKVADRTGNHDNGGHNHDDAMQAHYGVVRGWIEEDRPGS